MSVLLIVILAMIWVALAFWPARVAARNGHSFLGYFIFSVLLARRADRGLPRGGPHDGRRGPPRADRDLALKPERVVRLRPRRLALQQRADVWERLLRR